MPIRAGRHLMNLPTLQATFSGAQWPFSNIAGLSWLWHWNQNFDVIKQALISLTTNWFTVLKQSNSKPAVHLFSAPPEDSISQFLWLASLHDMSAFWPASRNSLSLLIFFSISTTCKSIFTWLAIPHKDVFCDRLFNSWFLNGLQSFAELNFSFQSNRVELFFVYFFIPHSRPFSCSYSCFRFYNLEIT